MWADLMYRSDSCLPLELVYMVVPRKLSDCVVYVYSNLIVGLDLLMYVRNVCNLSSPCFQIANMSSMKLIYSVAIGPSSASLSFCPFIAIKICSCV